MKSKTEGRAKIFFVIAIILTILVYLIFYFLGIKGAWYFQPIVVTLLALFYTFFPATSTNVLALILSIPAGVWVAVVGAVFWVAIFFIMISIFFSQVGLFISIFVLPGTILIYGGYLLLKGPGVTLGSVLFITAIIAYSRSVVEKSKKIICDTWVNGWKYFDKIARNLNKIKWLSFTLFPVGLIDYIWNKAKNIGEGLGGDIFPLIEW